MTMRATELVHETYLRLADQSTSFKNRAHFLALFARLLRRVVVDLLRHRSAAKRDRNLLVELQIDEADDTELASSTETIDWLGLDAALKDLSTRDPIAAQIVELRYFGGMNNDEIAAALDIGPATVGRHWRFARAWLHARLGSADEAR
jgi:RNA polymerase sigma factor (TIGR02999 family)